MSTRSTLSKVDRQLLTQLYNTRVALVQLAAICLKADLKPEDELRIHEELRAFIEEVREEAKQRCAA
jgi:hypothetical protein